MMMMTVHYVASKKIANGMMKMSGKAAWVMQEGQPDYQRSAVQNPAQMNEHHDDYYMRKQMALHQLMPCEFRKGKGSHCGSMSRGKHFGKSRSAGKSKGYDDGDCKQSWYPRRFPPGKGYSRALGR